jgi:hypothetical protein
VPFLQIHPRRTLSVPRSSVMFAKTQTRPGKT